MDETTRWVIGTILLAQTAIIGFLAKALWAHVVECREVRAQLGGIVEALKVITNEIGDHDRGIRGELHKHTQFLTRHEMDIETLKRKR